MNERPSDIIISLRQLWSEVLPTVAQPGEEQFNLWLKIHSGHVETVRHGLKAAAKRNIQLGFTMSLDHVIRFASKMMNVRAKQCRDLLARLEERAA